MPRPPAVKFPGYRVFDESRVEANDAMVALLVGSRLSSHLLEANAGSSAYLSEIYPAVRGIGRMYRTIDDTSQMLIEAERHLASMAIPYVWATYEELVNSAVKLFEECRMGPTGAERHNGLPGLHSYLERVSSIEFESDALALAELVRRIRVCIIHNGGRIRADLVDEWNSLAPSARTAWVGFAGHDLDVTKENLELTDRELVASLATTKWMARQISSLLVAALTAQDWSKAIVDDFLENYGRPLPGETRMLRRKVKGWVRMYYSATNATDSDIDSELLGRGL